jgi:hypothetical protein
VQRDRVVRLVWNSIHPARAPRSRTLFDDVRRLFVSLFRNSKLFIITIFFPPYYYNRRRVILRLFAAADPVQRKNIKKKNRRMEKNKKNRPKKKKNQSSTYCFTYPTFILLLPNRARLSRCASAQVISCISRPAVHAKHTQWASENTVRSRYYYYNSANVCASPRRLFIIYKTGARTHRLVWFVVAAASGPATTDEIVCASRNDTSAVSWRVNLVKTVCHDNVYPHAARTRRRRRHTRGRPSASGPPKYAVLLLLLLPGL